MHCDVVLIIMEKIGISCSLIQCITDLLVNKSFHYYVLYLFINGFCAYV